MKVTKEILMGQIDYYAVLGNRPDVSVKNRMYFKGKAQAFFEVLDYLERKSQKASLLAPIITWKKVEMAKVEEK